MWNLHQHSPLFLSWIGLATSVVDGWVTPALWPCFQSVDGSLAGRTNGSSREILFITFRIQSKRLADNFLLKDSGHECRTRDVMPKYLCQENAKILRLDLLGPQVVVWHRKASA